MEKLGKWKEKKFIDAVNELITYYNDRKYPKVIGLYESIFKKSGIDEEKLMTRDILPEVYVFAAYSYVEMGNYNKALEILDNLDIEYIREKIDKGLYNTVLLCFHQIYMYKKEFEKELEYAEKLIKNDPKLSTNYFRRGFAYLNLKRYEEAEKDLLYVLRRQGNLEIYYNLIMLYMETDRFKEALKYLEQAYIKYKKRGMEFIFLYIKIAIYIKLEDYENLSRTLESIYSIVPDNKPEYKILLLRIEGKSYSEAYDIIYKQIFKITENPHNEN